MYFELPVSSRSPLICNTTFYEKFCKEMLLQVIGGTSAFSTIKILKVEILNIHMQTTGVFCATFTVFIKYERTAVKNILWKNIKIIIVFMFGTRNENECGRGRASKQTICETPALKCDGDWTKDFTESTQNVLAQIFQRSFLGSFQLVQVPYLV